MKVRKKAEMNLGLMNRYSQNEPTHYNGVCRTKPTNKKGNNAKQKTANCKIYRSKGIT